MKNMAKIIWMLIRPINVILTVAMQYALYYILYDGSGTVAPNITDQNIHLLAGLSFACIAAGFVINDYYDRETDEINRPEKSLKLSSVSDRFLIGLYFILVLAGAICGLIFGFQTGSHVLLVLYLLATLLLWWYSKTLKSVPFWGNWVVAVFCASVIFIFPVLDFPYLSTSETQGVRTSNIFIGYSIFAFMITLIREITKDVEDRDGDSKSGMKTLATSLEPTSVKRILIFLYLVFLCFGLYATSWIGMKMQLSAFIAALALGPTTILAGWKLFGLEKDRSPTLASRYLKITMVMSLIFILIL